MKKILLVLFLISFLVVLAAPLITSAQVADCCKIKRTFQFEDITYTHEKCYGAIGTDPTTCGCTAANFNPTLTTEQTKSWGMGCILNTIYRVADLAFAILIAFAIIMILLAGYTFLTAGGAPEKVNKARDYILYALVGMIVAFLARAIPSIVKMLI